MKSIVAVRSKLIYHQLNHQPQLVPKYSFLPGRMSVGTPCCLHPESEVVAGWCEPFPVLEPVCILSQQSFLGGLESFFLGNGSAAKLKKAYQDQLTGTWLPDRLFIDIRRPNLVAGTPRMQQLAQNLPP